ncbi:MAG: PspC domain-containing protein [Anaerolineae bacterium]|nr:PspC domain-containing protein [Anaerolineae bacterium]MBT7069475.1 PspC domain-containing protein [Anaerolineae bacterium]MBT7325122.1 PspC domain-containing protein [Anaerolineae bacterium]
MTTVLYRSENDRMLGGVCGGLGNYLGVDTTLVRIFFVILFFGSGIGLLAYLALWIIAPSEGSLKKDQTWEESFKDTTDNFSERMQVIGQEFGSAMRTPHPKAGVIVGGSLIALGAVLFVENLNIYWLRWLSFDVLWPVLLIIAGGVILVRRTQGVSHE